MRIVRTLTTKTRSGAHNARQSFMDLPPYQIARFMLQGYRKYTCEGCVEIPKDLPEKYRRDYQITIATEAETV